MTYMLGVFGSAAGSTTDVEEKARQIGVEIAAQGCILASGGCAGLPYIASKAAFSHGGKTIAFSPGRNLDEHVNKHSFPSDVFTDFVWTPEEFPYGDVAAERKYRNVVSCYEVDAGIVIGGRIGTLNEFTNLFDFGKVIGLLEGTGGSTVDIPVIVKRAGKKSSAILILEQDPSLLVKKIIEELDRRK